MPFTEAANAKFLNSFAAAAALGAPATHYVGLFTGTTFVPSVTYTVGQYVIPTTFNSIPGDIGKIFKVTTASSAAGTEPTWPTTGGATVTTGGVTFTECTVLFQAGTITGLEMTGTAYGRVAITANATNFPAASVAEPAIIQNGTVITYPTPGADWGKAIGFGFFDASSAGVLWNWGATTSALDCSTGSTVSFGVDTVTLQLQAA